jgi:serine/threonine protein kinase
MCDEFERLRTRLEEWPSCESLTPEAILREFPALASDPRARELVAVERYVRSLDGSTAAQASSVVGWLPSHIASMDERLREILPASSTSSIGSAVDSKSIFPREGESVGGYLLLRELGRGAFARVFLAVDQNVGNRRVAVKFTSSPGSEAALLAGLRHPNLPQILTCSYDDVRQLHVICMEYVGAETLASVLSRWGRQKPELDSRRCLESTANTIESAVRILTQVASAVAHAHESGLLHLDIKPTNVVMRDDGEPVLIDFNLGLPTSGAGCLGFRGTVGYAAPEVLDTAAHGGVTSVPIGPAADVYSLGVVLYEALTGRLPWPKSGPRTFGEEVSSALESRRHWSAPSSLNPEVPADLDRIVRRALAFSPTARFATARELHRELMGRKAGYLSWLTSRLTVLGMTTAAAAGLILFLPADASRRDMTAHHGTVSTRPIMPSGAPLLPQPKPVGPNSTTISATHASRSIDGAVESVEVQIRKALAQRLEEQSGVLTLSESDRGFALLMLEKYAEATNGLRQGVGGEPDAGKTESQCNLAYCMLQRLQYRAAAFPLDRLLKNSPDCETALFLRAVAECYLALDDTRPPSSEWLLALRRLNTERADELLLSATASYRRVLSLQDRPNAEFASSLSEWNHIAQDLSGPADSQVSALELYWRSNPRDVLPLPPPLSEWSRRARIGGADDPRLKQLLHDDSDSSTAVASAVEAD